MRSAANSGALFGESIYGKTAFGRPVGNNENLFGLGASIEQEYADKAIYSWNKFTDLVGRIARVASKEERANLMVLVGHPGNPDSLASEANYVNNDIREANQYTPMNIYVWSNRQNRNQADRFEKLLKPLGSAVSEAEARVGILPPEQAVQEVVREVIVIKEALPPPVPLPPTPPPAGSPPPYNPARTELITTGATPWIVGGAAVAAGLGLWFFLRRK